MGGIVSRLTREAALYDQVWYGPSDDVLLEGICFWSGASSTPAYWDDRLTEDELNLVCGVYKVDTGKELQDMIAEHVFTLHSGQNDSSIGRCQMTDISWWLKPATWEISGLNIWFWSRDCEGWYQKCIDDIWAERAGL
jgi:hypothetical protein